MQRSWVSNWLVVLAGAGVLVSAVGCNTEPMWAQHRQTAGAPVTKADAPEGVKVPDIKVSDAREIDLVEQVLTHRAMYKRSLAALRDYYSDHGMNDKRKWAEYEIADFNRIKPFKYIVDAEVPPTSLHPSHSVAEADEMYEKGVKLMKEGGHGVPILYREDKMQQAVQVFSELIEKYPNSDKIDDAAFNLGEIYKEYFTDQEAIAVKWYERALQWNPKTPHPVRFQAAVVYDFRLHDRAKALEYYKSVLKEETGDSSNVSFATRRIYQLTEGRPELTASTGGAADDSGPRSGAAARSATEADAQDLQVAGEQFVPVAEPGANKR